MKMTKLDYSLTPVSKEEVQRLARVEQRRTAKLAELKAQLGDKYVLSKNFEAKPLTPLQPKRSLYDQIKGALRAVK